MWVTSGGLSSVTTRNDQQELIKEKEKAQDGISDEPDKAEPNSSNPN